MKKRLKVVLFLALGIAVLIYSCTIVVTPSGDQWSLYYTWNGSQEGYAVWMLYSDGTFNDNYQGKGDWGAYNSFFQLAYNNSTYFYAGTVYTGTIKNSNHMIGTMSGPGGYGHGTWEAYRGVHGYRGPTSSSEQGLGFQALSPSGRLIESQQSKETNE